MNKSILEATHVVIANNQHTTVSKPAYSIAEAQTLMCDLFTQGFNKVVVKQFDASEADRLKWLEAANNSLLKSVKRLEDIKNAAEKFIDDYDAIFGTPEEWQAYHALRHLLNDL